MEEQPRRGYPVWAWIVGALTFFPLIPMLIGRFVPQSRRFLGAPGVIVSSILLIIIFGVFAALAPESENQTRSNPVGPSVQPTKVPEIPLFADASDGIQQFVGGQTMPLGRYEFDCSFTGNVSVQLGSSPYTVSMKSGDQIHTIRSGDLVTMGYCKAYGPQ